METLTEGAFAKLNLTLDVLRKRDDGYHDLQMILQTISLRDDVTITLGTGEPWAVHCYRETAKENGELELNTDGFPQDGENLAWKAAKAYFERTGKDPGGLEIFISKRIPAQSGLGGGSADAAAVLRALDRHDGNPLSIPALCELGFTVGCDVPFCVLRGTALVEGRGELLTKLPDAPDMYYVVCKPDFSISTPELYRKLDSVQIKCRPDTQGIISALEAGDLAGVARRMYNVFESVPDHRRRSISAIRGALLDRGALGSVMTGSGSAVFGIFPDEAAARSARDGIGKNLGTCFLARNISAERV